MTRWLVVGIGGVTCSGKSTLAARLNKALSNSLVVHQDTYFLPENDPRHVAFPELNCFNWDVPSSIDIDKMISDISEIMSNPCSNPRLLIIDGFLIYSDRRISDLCNIKYFLTLPREECWQRRRFRVYEPPDVPGYFDRVVWPEYERSFDKIKNDNGLMKQIKIVNGTWSPDEIFNKIFHEISQFLK